MSACAAPEAPAPIHGEGENGGAIVLFAEPEGLVFNAVLYSSASAPFPAIPRGDGKCVLTPASAMGMTNIAVVDLDLGPAVTLSDGVSPQMAPKEASAGYADVFGARHALPGADRLNIQTQGASFDYLSGFAIPAFGRTWTLTNAGAHDGLQAGTLATITLPAQITQDPTFESAGSIVPGSPANVSWSGGDGAALFHVYAAGAAASADCYVAAGTTRLELPASVTAQLGPGAYAIVDAENMQVVHIAGREVLVVSGADNLD
ncbi:MAG TPA: hypothetical protein VMV18_08165 [bacterium]|nr:hypothetical protein [bacterium]